MLSLSCAKRENVINPEAPLWLHRPAWAVHVDFRRLLVAEQGTSSKTGLEKSVPAIDSLHGRIFVGSSDHGEYALRAGDGSTIWRFQTGSSVSSEAAYDAELDIVWFGSDDDGLYAARARDGKMLWRYSTGAEVQRKPVVVERPGGKKILVFVNAADSVFATDAATGKPLWKRVRTPALGLEISGHAGVAVDNDRVYAAFSTGRVVAYDVDTGQDKWPEVDLTGTTGATEEQQQYFDVDTTPIVRGDRVFVASVATGVFALDATGGAQIWKQPKAEGVSWLTYWTEPSHKDVDTGVALPPRALLIAGSGTTGFWALDPKNGDVVWRQRAPRGAFSFPVEIGGVLLVTSSKLGIFLFDPLLGQPIDGIDPGSGFSGGAGAYGNRAYVLSNGGVLFGLDVTPPTKEPLTPPKSW
jgi:outer membrane protein assembly factor BamB